MAQPGFSSYIVKISASHWTLGSCGIQLNFGKRESDSFGEKNSTGGGYGFYIFNRAIGTGSGVSSHQRGKCIYSTEQDAGRSLLYGGAERES